MKRMLKWAIALALLAAFFCCGAAFADTTGTDGNITWTLSDDGVLTVSGNGPMNSYSETYSNGRYITTAPWGATATSVEIVEGVTSIGDKAFYGCTNLNSVTIPEGVISIGSYAFCSCTSLTSLRIPEGVISMGSYAFNNCSSLMSITIPDSVTSIGNAAFNSCSSLLSITIPESITSIGYQVFCNCNNLSNVIIPEGVTSIGNYAFAYCRNLNSITIPEGVTRIDDYAFSNCSSLRNITIPEAVTRISNFAFADCSSLANVTIQTGVTSIGNYAFRGCTNLTSIMIPESVLEIGGYAFDSCSSLTSITLPEGITSIVGSVFSGCINLASVRIPESVISIGNSAFYGCSSLTSITIPDSVTSIGDDAFRGCSGLTSVTIPAGVTSIGNQAFSGCSSLTSVTIPAGVTSIGNQAFSGCSSLTSVTIPAGVTSIGYNAFSGCSSLTNIMLPNTVTSIGDHAFFKCRSLTSITIPAGVTSIGNSAFYECYSLTNITIPDSVITFGSDNLDPFNGYYGKIICSLESPAAYYLGTRYKSFRIPGTNYDLRYRYENNVVVGLELAGVDPSIETFEIPAGVTIIGDEAFMVCSNLTSITIPAGVTYIDGCAFCGCTSLTSITLPEGVTSIGIGAFQSCSKLASVSIPGSVTAIGSEAFSYCYNLTAVTIPEGVESIGDRAFYDCSSLTRLVIPESVHTFGTDIVSSNPTIYCYSFSDADYWASGEMLSSIYLDEILPADAREVTMEQDFRLAIGDVRSLAYNVFPTYDNPIVTWSSSNPVVLTVENGVVTGLRPGNATVTAVCDQATASVTVTVYKPAVDFELLPAEAWVLARTETCQLTAQPEPSDAEISLSFQSSDTNLATVDGSGLVTTIKPGDVTITATSERGIQRTALIHLCYPVKTVELAAPRDRMMVGRQMQLIATVTPTRGEVLENHLVNFTSSDEAIATVDSSTGLVNALAVGEVTITATGNSHLDSVTIQVIDVCDDHVPVIDEGVDPTCEEPGLTEGSHCAICDEVLTTGDEIPALGHSWNEAVTYAWSSDNTAVTAHLVCTRDATHIYEETVGVCRIATVSPTKTTEGSFKYVSETFESEVCAVQEKDGGVIPALSTLNAPAFPASLTAIEAEAFAGTPFQAVIVPNTVTAIGSRAFADCRNLVYVCIPASVTSIASDAFADCPHVIIDRAGE